MSKDFKVATVSTNTNSFGLYGMILIAEDGEAWQVAANSLNKKSKGDVLTIPNCRHDDIDYLDDPYIPNFCSFGFEIPHQLKNAPDTVVEEVWEFSPA